MAEKVDTPDGRVARIARRQHGVVSIAQLREAGLSDDAVLGRVRAGRLFRLHRGVYAVGHTAHSFRGLCMGAALAGGNGAVVSHRSAAMLWRLLDPAKGPIHISVQSRSGRIQKRPRLRIHRCPSLSTEHVTRRHGIPVTSPVRTIADLRSELEEPQLRRAVRQAEVLGLRTGLEAAAPTRSELEDRFLALCRRHRLAPPEVNVRVGRWEVDFLWRQQRLVVETDGYRYHRGQAAFEDDHARDLALRAAGLNVLRLTYQQVTNKPSQVATVLRRELGAKSNPPSLTS